MRCAALIAIALLGCRDETLRQVKAIRDEVCACQTVPCGEEAIKRLPKQDGKPHHRAQAFAAEMITCMSKLYLKDRPSEDPDDPAEPSSPGSSAPASPKTP
ncbi:MAG: hypothetical protein H0V17_02880 [Deltaproteobacteria bacterium]|nr:hypothetical protein [Deltaproteobacteria bacterium]